MQVCVKDKSARHCGCWCFSWFFQNENGDIPSSFLVGSTPVTASAHGGRERFGELSSVSSTSSSMSSLPQSPAQAMAYRGREGSFESRYQSPLEDFRVSQEALFDHMDPQNRRRVWGTPISRLGFKLLTPSRLCFPHRMLLRTKVSGENRVWVRANQVSVPLQPLPATVSPSFYADDVTDCCERCFHGNGRHHLAYIRGSFPLPLFFRHLPPPPKEAVGQRRGEGHWEEARSCGQEEEKRSDIHNRTQSKTVKVLVLDCAFCDQFIISAVFVHNSCFTFFFLFEWGAESTKRDRFETVSGWVSLLSCFCRTENIYLFLLCVRSVGEQQQPTTLLWKSFSLHVFHYSYLNL